MQNKAQKKRIEEHDKKTKTHCPFCSAPLIEELGIKKCQNPSCTFREIRKVEQSKIIE